MQPSHLNVKHEKKWVCALIHSITCRHVFTIRKEWILLKITDILLLGQDDPEKKRRGVLSQEVKFSSQGEGEMQWGIKCLESHHRNLQRGRRLPDMKLRRPIWRIAESQQVNTKAMDRARLSALPKPYQLQTRASPHYCHCSR